MKALISDALIKKLPTKPRAYDVRDTQLKGFVLRVQARTGTKSYLVEYGRNRKFSLGQHPVLKSSEAREKARLVLGEVFTGGDPQGTLRRSKAHTLESFIEQEYLPWSKAHLRTAEATAANILKSFKDYKNRGLGTLDPWLVEQWRTKRLNEGLKASTINRAFGALKTALNRASEWGFIDANPIASVKLLREDNNLPPRYLSKDEYRRLLRALDDREREIRKKRKSGTNGAGSAATRSNRL